MIMGEDAVRALESSRVAVFGAGGVGGYVIEALARSGVGHIDIIDNDKVCASNINRQIIATEDTVGRYKVDVARERILSINPAIKVKTYRCFYLPDGRTLDADGNVVKMNVDPERNTAENEQDISGGDQRKQEATDIDFSKYDYIVDAVDTVTAKLGIIAEAGKHGIPVISAMGCGNRLDPTKLKVADIFETKGDPLSKIMRKELKKRGIDSLKVVYSTEEPIKPITAEDNGKHVQEAEESSLMNEQESMLKTEQEQDGTENNLRVTRRDTPGSAVFVPAAAGLIIASVVCRELAGS